MEIRVKKRVVLGEKVVQRIFGQSRSWKKAKGEGEGSGEKNCEGGKRGSFRPGFGGKGVGFFFENKGKVTATNKKKGPKDKCGPTEKKLKGPTTKREGSRISRPNKNLKGNLIRKSMPGKVLLSKRQSMV